MPDIATKSSEITMSDLEKELRKSHKSFLSETVEYYEIRKNTGKETAEALAVNTICEKAREALVQFEHINTPSEALSSVENSSFGKTVSDTVRKRRKKEKKIALANERRAKRNLKFEKKCAKQGLDLNTEKQKRAKTVKILTLISVLLYIVGVLVIAGAVALCINSLPLDANGITRVGLVALIGAALFLIGLIVGKTGRELKLD